MIADTSPINYLIQIGQIELLPRLFERVMIPGTVQTELANSRAPLAVQRWIDNPPGWLEIPETPDYAHLAAEGLDDGESAAIALAESRNAELLLIDDREGVRVATRRGLRTTGTLGVLDLAAAHGLVDFAAAITELERTNFRLPRALLMILLEKHKG